MVRAPTGCSGIIVETGICLARPYMAVDMGTGQQGVAEEQPAAEMAPIRLTEAPIRLTDSREERRRGSGMDSLLLGL